MFWINKLWVSGSAMLLTLSACSLSSFLTVMKSGTSLVLEWSLLSLEGGSMTGTFIFDWVSLLFVGVVLFISGNVLFYSGEYLHGDPYITRFLMLVLLFVASMGAMIFSPNLVSILLGWDGLGLVSYALVIYYQSSKSAGAGAITAITNRIGDAALLVGIGVMFHMGGFNFFNVGGVSVLAVWLVGIAATTKSAQIPFSAWLPAAMAAPTPVSALVHSSTLVTAGVYLLYRFSPVLEQSGVGFYLLGMGVLTSLMAGIGANFEFDLKKIIALSTLSQLGVMVTAVSGGIPLLGFMHLLTHALFKALLFLGAGSVIHSVSGSQDIRAMGGLFFSMPLTLSLMTIANAALCGFPFLAGFYSKDLIIESFFSGAGETLGFLYFIATGLTACYSMRLTAAALGSAPDVSSLNITDESKENLTKSMLGLGLGAVVGGSALSWLMFPVPEMVCLPFSVKMSIIFAVSVGGAIGGLLWLGSLKGKVSEKSEMFSMMWFLPPVTIWGVGAISNKAGDFFCLNVDKGWFEGGGGMGAYAALGSGSTPTGGHPLYSLKSTLVLAALAAILLVLYI